MAAEPLTLQHGAAKGTGEALTAMGHKVVRAPQIAGVMNGAEYFPDTRQTRAGNNGALPSGQTDYRQMGAVGGQ